MDCVALGNGAMVPCHTPVDSVQHRIPISFGCDPLSQSYTCPKPCNCYSKSVIILKMRQSVYKRSVEVLALSRRMFMEKYYKFSKYIMEHAQKKMCGTKLFVPDSS